MKKYAPILITTLNRDKHFRTTLESLKNCIGAEFTDVYIGLDYPPSEKYEQGYKAICEYLEKGDFSCFKSFNVIRRKDNFGPRKNSLSLEEAIYPDYDLFIKMEDDIEVSKNFLIYMNSAFEYYNDDDDVIAVSGYSYPINWKCDDNANIIKNNYVASTWGIGLWGKKIIRLRSIINDGYMYKCFGEAYKSGKLELMVDACLIDYLSTILYYAKSGEKIPENSFFTSQTDICMRAYLAVADKYVIIPTLSHTRNHGFDGSGQICSAINKKEHGEDFADNYDYDNQPIDNSENYQFTPSKNNYFEENRNLYNHFDRREKTEVDELLNEIKTYKKIGPALYRARYLFKCYSKAAINKLFRKNK